MSEYTGAEWARQVSRLKDKLNFKAAEIKSNERRIAELERELDEARGAIRWADSRFELELDGEYNDDWRRIPAVKAAEGGGDE